MIKIHLGEETFSRPKVKNTSEQISEQRIRGVIYVFYIDTILTGSK